MAKNMNTSRRTLLAAGASLGAAVAAGMGSAQAQAEPRIFVLVHGAWHGGWCWRRVADRLRAGGHTVFTPTLTGLGERAHLLRAGIGLDTHITDVVNAMAGEELTDVLLCGHSYGGFVISGVAERLAPAIRALVFLDAFMPRNGETVQDR